MNKWKWAVALLLALALGRVEHTGSGINELEPVEVVLITETDGNIVIETDTGAKGIGSNLEKAVNNLQSSASGIIFLDTAQYVLVTAKTKCMLVEMMQWIRPAARVCMIRSKPELSEVTEYLGNHPPELQLKDIAAGDTDLQILYIREGRGQLAQ